MCTSVKSGIERKDNKKKISLTSSPALPGGPGGPRAPTGPYHVVKGCEQ